MTDTSRPRDPARLRSERRSANGPARADRRTDPVRADRRANPGADVRDDARGTARELMGTGVVAAAWALAAGLVCVTVPVLLAWAADGRSGAGAPEALRTAMHVWLAAHGTTLSLMRGEFGLAPTGLLALPVLLLVRAGGHAAQAPREARTLRRAAGLTAAVAAPYAAAVTVVALASASDAVQPRVPSALLGGALVGTLGAGIGVLRRSRLGPAAWAALPAPLRETAGPVLVAVSILLGAGALLAGASLALHADQAVSLASSTSPGVVGGIGLLLVGLAYVPVAVVWGAAWWVGTGFAVGVGTSVGPFGVTLATVPVLPLFAAVPASPPPWWAGVLALAVPLLAGVSAGAFASRRGPVGRRRMAVVGAGTGGVLAALCALSAGPLGEGRLAEVGPNAFRTGLAVAVIVTVGGLGYGAVSRRTGRPAKP